MFSAWIWTLECSLLVCSSLCEEEKKRNLWRLENTNVMIKMLANTVAVENLDERIRMQESQANAVIHTRRNEAYQTVKIQHRN